MTGTRWTGRILLLLAACLAVSCAAEEPKALAGFKLEGTHWTYQDDQVTMNGILVKPEGPGPFPAVLISHGKGGGAEQFGAGHARALSGWGLVCIAPNYTHAGRGEAGPGPSRDGASEENLRRARKCLDILESLPYVDREHLGAYGHSMGGFVTIGLTAMEPRRIKAAAISGSGISPREGYPAPSSQQAEKIRTPFLMLHGSNDTTVRPSQSQALREVLERNRVPNEYHLFEGEGHPIDRTRQAEVYPLLRSWFERHGVLKPAGNDPAKETK